MFPYILYHKTEKDATHVRLIPKILNPKRVADYRPIALCSVYYKIIAKLLTKRLQPILGNIIAENQSAFIPNRAISDNVLITHEVLHYLKTSGAKQRCYMAVKTDMTKAYDRLEWDFIELVMRKMGFHEQWIHWIMNCIRTVSYSYLINGAPMGHVIPTRGIRQGDPISPFVFILCSEVLSGLCSKAAEDGSLKGVRVANPCPRINHLLFADDTMFFCRSDSESCKTLMNIFTSYETASGQKINRDKSAITFSSKTPQTTKERVKNQLSITREGGLGKYLGLPEHFGRKKKDLFSMIVDRIRQKSRSWSTRRLSAAGKMVMLKSVLSAIPTYTMSCFKLPLSLCKRIQSVLTRFWWDKEEEKRNMCWISWQKLTQSKRDGGLGFRDIQRFNDSLLAKLSWRIITNPQCLLARTLTGKYCRSESFLTCNPPNNSSHGWRSICIGRDLLKANLGKCIGNGQQTSIWYDDWLSLSEQKRPIGPPTEDSQHLCVSDLIHQESGDWNLTRIRELLPLHEKDITALKPSKLGAADKYIWIPSTSGEYSSKSGYHGSSTNSHQETANAPPSITEWNKDVWNLNLAPKVKMFIWRLLHNSIPVGETLKSRKVNPDVKCPFCNSEESPLHLFFHCNFAKEIWNQAPLLHPIDTTSIRSLHQGLKISKNMICLPPTGIGSTAFGQWIIWAIWTERNKKVFNENPLNAADTLSKAINLARDWNSAQLQKPRPSSINPRISQHPIDPELITCHSDAAWLESRKLAGSGWLFTDPNGNSLSQGSTTDSHVSSPLIAEAIALLHAMDQGLSQGYKKLIFASDSQSLVKAIQTRISPKEIHGILQDILKISLDFTSVFFISVPREANVKADHLAKSALYLL